MSSSLFNLPYLILVQKNKGSMVKYKSFIKKAFWAFKMKVSSAGVLMLFELDLCMNVTFPLQTSCGIINMGLILYFPVDNV